ncbi:hypothetical protein NXS98_12360 [Fontisphaera persica]|uniref:hypothetical protein n=1 Tax=Fontisphaera persica TaxID=2974023 RepID=UPI0024BF7273|nr:hypothetical protein [Fontisphaera persica]WCJ58510.1 hypothetical protein NXS98_12360 [Fontisphaera persica]
MLRLILLWWLAGAWILPVQAVHFLPLSIEELAAQAQLVVQGTVLSRACQQDEAGRIYTRVELQVKEVWKGQLAETRLTLVHGGGVVGEKRTVVTGQAELAVGEEVVVFLVFNARGEAVLVGLRQGAFHVQTPAAGGEAQAGNGFAHAPRLPSGAAGLMPQTAPPRTWVPLSELRRRVKELEARP